MSILFFLFFHFYKEEFFKNKIMVGYYSAIKN